MAFISNVLNYFCAVEIKQPTGVWEKIIMAFHSGIPNYAWAIIVFTLVLKTALLPLDFFNKRITAKNAKIQAIVQPEIEKLQKKYGNNKQILNQKTMELYKKNNYSVTGACFIMLIYMALTLFIFITLFSGLNSMASYKVGYQYQEMEKVYIERELAGASEEEINKAVVEKYNEVKNSWLWIDNVWKSDVPWKKSLTSFDEFVSLTKITYKDELAENEQETFLVRLSANKEADKAQYEKVMKAIESENRVNGYLIIPIVAVAVNILSMLASQGKLKFKRKKKVEGEERRKQPSGILMLILLPALMGYIAITYNAVFGLYILMNSLFSLATTPLVNLINKKFDAIAEKKREKKKEDEKLSYKR